MVEETNKKCRGGRREGAGRPKSVNPSKLYTFRVGGKIAECLDAQENRTEFIRDAIEMAMIESEPDFSQLGAVYPATKVKEMKMNFFDIGIVAGFPVPLDNDERAQSIELLQMLNYYGIHTPLEFAEKSESWVRSHFHKPGQQTWLELNGIPCVDTTEIKRNQSICTSRSFGEMVSDLPSLKASIATFASSCANKLRGQGSVCKSVTVFIGSNRFREDLPQYGNSAYTTFTTATSDSLEITNAALRCLESIYVPGIMYKRSGVMVGDITPACPLQLDLFDKNKKRKERKDLMCVLDNVNQRYGVKTIRLAVEDGPISYGAFGGGWHVKCEHRSPNYLTDIHDILTIKI